MECVLSQTTIIYIIIIKERRTFSSQDFRNAKEARRLTQKIAAAYPDRRKGFDRMENFIPFALPDIGEEEINEAVDSLRSGWLTTGPKAKRFENDFTQFLGDERIHALAVNSATSGLHLALEALGIGPGDEVITTAYTFTATAEVIRYLGANPVFVDIDPSTMNISPAAMEAAVTPRTRALLPVHFGGLAADMDAILDIARRHHLPVVEDAAHALPATRGGKMIGALDSDTAVFSFYATKTITTGEGGMIVTRDDRIASRCRTMRLHGIDRDVFNRYTARKAAWYYEIIAPGFKYNMTDIAASIGIHQLKKATAFCSKRAEIARYYDDVFRELPVELPPHAPEGDIHSWHLYILRLREDAPVTRDRFIEKMFEYGIGTSVHFIPLCIQPYWRQTCCLRAEDFPHTLESYRRAVSIPVYPKLTDRQVEYIAQTAHSILTG
jgi:dTDP-4-amino-4,6-dideoxygalactose transaminase